MLCHKEYDDYLAHYGFHINHSGCDVIIIWLTAIGFWLQCL